MNSGESVISTGIDVEHECIYLTGEVNEAMYKRVAYGLIHLKMSKEITIVLNTFGGDFYQALAIYDLLRFSQSHIKVLCVGPVMSAGIIILMAAHDRVGLPNSQLMIHYGKESSESVTDVKHNEELLKIWKNMLALHTKVSKRRISNWFKHNTYFTAEKAVKVGLLHRVAK